MDTEKSPSHTVSLFYSCPLNCFSKCEMVLKIKLFFYCRNFQSYSLRITKKDLWSVFHVYAALRFIFISRAVLAFPGIQFRGCWDGLTGNSHQVVCQPAGGRAALTWKENKGTESRQTAHWAPRRSASRTRTPAAGSPEEDGTRAKE